MSKWRSIDAAHAAIKERDPDSAVTKHLIRALVKSGEVASMKARSKILLDLTSLFEYLNIKSAS